VLYLTLNLRPPIRYVHVGTAMSLGRPQRERVCAEVRAAIPHVKFVVSDLHRLTVLHDYVLELEPDGLPWMIPDWQRVQFPFDQPLAFRSSGGRYLVHRIENPVGECVIPMALDEPDPPEGWQMPANAPPRRRWKASWRDPD
jgi:hypothetical protein